MPADEIVWTVVVGGGTGRRFGGPKQFEVVGDRRVIDHAVDVAVAVSAGVVVVLPGDAPALAAGTISVTGGTTRSESVRNGLAAVPASATIVCVHDAARPFASRELYRAVVDAVAAGADGAVPGLPVTDTIKLVGDDVVTPGRSVRSVRPVVQTLARESLVAVQTPQAFRAGVLRAVHAAGHDATDDAALVEQAGGHVVVVAGDARNRKLTHPADLAWARTEFGASA